MGLLELPEEIRKHIWKSLLTRRCPVDVLFERTRKRKHPIQEACRPKEVSPSFCKYLEFVCRASPPDEYPPWLYHPDQPVTSRISESTEPLRCIGPLFSVGLLRVCKQIYLEAVDIMYTSNTFILGARTMEEIPLSRINLQRITFLQLNILSLRSERNLLEYQRIVGSLQSNRFTNLIVISDSKERALLHGLVASLSSMAPVKSCALHLGPCYSEAKALGMKLMGQDGAQLFPRYNDLPKELRNQILSYTDLVQQYHVRYGRLVFDRECCRYCSGTLFPCCCNNARKLRGSTATGARFSSQCRCETNPRALLQASSGLRAEALVVMFGRPSRFIFDAETQQNLLFLHMFKSSLPHLRDIMLRLDTMDLPQWRMGENIGWDEFVECLLAHCNLPALSIRLVTGDWHRTIWHDGRTWDDNLDYYRTFIPGVRKLINGGVKKADFQIGSLLNKMNPIFNDLLRGREAQAERSQRLTDA